MKRIGATVVMLVAALALFGGSAGAYVQVSVPDGGLVVIRSAAFSAQVVATGLWGADPFFGVACLVLPETLDGMEGYRYGYSFSGGGITSDGGRLSHWIMGISPIFDQGNIGYALRDVSWDDNPLIEIATLVDDYGPGDSGNPGIPGALHGVKFERIQPQGAELPLGYANFSFWSPQDPVWGSFYAKDGVADGVQIYAYNAGLATRAFAESGDNLLGYLPVPDSTPITIIPEPATFLLFLQAAVAGAYALRRKGGRKAA